MKEIYKGKKAPVKVLLYTYKTSLEIPVTYLLDVSHVKKKKKKSNDKEKWNANAQLINEDKWIMKTTLVICWAWNESITMDEEIWLLQFKWTEVLYEVVFIIYKIANILMLSRNIIALVNLHGKNIMIQ